MASLTADRIPAVLHQDVGTALCALVQAARREAPKQVDAWLLQLLVQRPDIADSSTLQPAWQAFTGDSSTIDAWLKAGNATDSQRGSGVMAAFPTPNEIQPWLDHSATEQAAWEQLVIVSPDVSVFDAMAAEERVPSIETLRLLRRRGLLDALIDASVSWNSKVRLQLWRRAARLYSGVVRARLLAGCG